MARIWPPDPKVAYNYCHRFDASERPTMNVDDTIVSPHVPPDTLGGWITTVRGLVEEVEMNRELERLPARAISTRLRGLLEQMRAAAYGRSR